MAVAIADDTLLAAIPAGRHGLSADEVAASQLARMVRAMAECVGEQGYGPTTVGDVVARAGVSRKTFYAHFADKEACFLAAYDACAAILEERIVAAVPPGAAELQHALRSVLTSYLEALQSERTLARAFLVEVQGAGPAALARRRAIHARWAGLLAALRPDLPPEVARAALGAVHELVVDALEGDRDLLELTDLAVSIQTALLTHDHPGALTSR